MAQLANQQISKKHCAAGITLYNSVAEQLQKTIDSLKGQVEHFFIVDNTPGRNLTEQFAKQPDITYIPNEENRGIAAALNQIMQAASNAGYAWVLTMDQDSVFPKNGVGVLTQKLAELSPNTAAICPVFLNRSNNDIVGTEAYVKECITSGAFTSVEAWHKVGGYNEWYFIDLVDFEFCARLRATGYKIYQTESVQLSHQLGSPKETHFLGLTFSSFNYPAFRYYYQTRNYLVFEQTYQTPTTNPSPTLLIKRILLVDDNKPEKLHAVLRGIRDARHHLKKPLR